MIHTPPASPQRVQNINGEQPLDDILQPPVLPQLPQERQISRISMRAPPFWKENPALWFTQLESQFITNGITISDTKYHIAVAALETSIINQVSDVVLNPPAINKYETLKQRLQERFTESEERRFKKLLGAIDLGDKMPSHLWREMRDLAGERVSENLLKSLWLQRLQPHAQAILSSSDGDMVRMTTMADKIHEVIDTRGINAISQHKPSSNINLPSASSEIDDLQQQILTLTKQVSALVTTVDENTRQRGRSIHRSTSRSSRQRSSSSSHHPGQCWYHNVFGEKAHKCISPCSFKSSKN